MLGHQDGFDNYSAAVDLDVIYTRGSTLFNTTNGINGGGAVGLNSFSSLTLTSTNTWGTLSAGGVVRAACWVKVSTYFGGDCRLLTLGTNLFTAQTTNAPIIGLKDTGAVYVTRHGDTTIVATSAAGLVPVAQFRHIQYEAKYAEAPDGYIKVWVDKNLVITFTGDTLTGTQPTSLSNWRLWTDNNGLTAFDDMAYWDDSGTDFTGQIMGEHEIRSYATAADDGAQEFTPLSSTNESNVDDPVFHDSDTTYNESLTIGHKDLFTMADQSSTPLQILAIGVFTTAKKVDVGGTTLRNRIKHGSTTVEGTDKTLTTSYVKYYDFWGKNPDTAAAWANTDQTGVSAGYKYQA